MPLHSDVVNMSTDKNRIKKFSCKLLQVGVNEIFVQVVFTDILAILGKNGFLGDVK